MGDMGSQLLEMRVCRSSETKAEQAGRTTMCVRVACISEVRKLDDANKMDGAKDDGWRYSLIQHGTAERERERESTAATAYTRFVYCAPGYSTATMNEKFEYIVTKPLCMNLNSPKRQLPRATQTTTCISCDHRMLEAVYFPSKVATLSLLGLDRRQGTSSYYVRILSLHLSRLEHIHGGPYITFMWDFQCYSGKHAI